MNPRRTEADRLPSWDDLRVGARLLRDLPGFLRRPLDPAQARQRLQARLERREQDFLDLMQRAVYALPGNPYRELLQRAGCELGDLRRTVLRDGVEEALVALARAGVYLTADELKGRVPILRGRDTIAGGLDRLGNPDRLVHTYAQSSGSGGARSTVPVDLRFVGELAVNICLTTQARGGLHWHHASWTIPGSAAMAAALSYSAFGAHWVRWFSQVDPTAPELHARYRWSGRILSWGARLAGTAVAAPEHVPLEDPQVILQWLADTRRRGFTPHLLTFPSSAMRLCRAAERAGESLDGTELMLGGEPITRARLAVIEQLGARATTGYGSAETGPCGVADACLAPRHPDEVHVFHDLHALIGAPATPEPTGPVPGTLLATSLRSTAPIVLLNASLGDRAELERRACGCPLEDLGWTTHLHDIRSHEKLTGGGMAFLESEIAHVLDTVLPARFGGRPSDYQLVEREGANGSPLLELRADPALGRLDAADVRSAFLEAIAPGSGVERLMSMVWRQTGVLEVERGRPLTTATGKILPIHRTHDGTTDAGP